MKTRDLSGSDIKLHVTGFKSIERNKKDKHSLVLIFSSSCYNESIAHGLHGAQGLNSRLFAEIVKTW